MPEKRLTQKEILQKISEKLEIIDDLKSEIRSLRTNVDFLMRHMNYVEETIKKFYDERQEYEKKMMERDQFLIDRAIELTEAAGAIKKKRKNDARTDRKKNKRAAANG